MLYKGLLITAASGKIDGLIASHNRGGAYFKAHVIPVDPNTTEQQVMRDAMTSVAANWNAFSATERARWAAYAETRLIPNRLGEPRRVTGRAQYARYAIPRAQAIAVWATGSEIGTNPPQSGGWDFGHPPTFTLHPGSTTLRISWDTLEWPGSDDHDYCNIYVSPPRPQVQNWFRGPFTLLGGIAGDPDMPVTPPFDLALPADYQPGPAQRLFVRLRMSRQDYDLSTPHLATLNYVAP